ncbi:VWA domain-containing protein [Natrinema pallidum]|uniref:VWA domain-containing protein n=1 Tax=Natrinema pallidum TaxID=69527 RepID=A0A4P9TJQ8_9EURY|nr:vWA domain-containing protein [Natrinema pallidum]QCW05238.1 VWA domain-containing protein [Natrinema pallidum]
MPPLELSDRHFEGIKWLFDPETDDSEPGDPDEDELDLELALLAESDDTDDESDLSVDFEWSDDSIRETAVESYSPRDRDERIADYSGDAPHGEIRAHVRDRGLAEDMREALQDIATEEHETTAAEGDLLDMRNAIRRLAGDTTIDEYYRRPTTYPADDLAVGISIDMSGSMRSTELEAKAAVGTFLFAVDQLGGSVVANAWHYQNGAVKVRMLTGSSERFQWRHLDGVEPGGGDPIARGMRYCGNLLERTTASEKLLFVITDGKPNVESLPDEDYGSPLLEADHVAGELRQRGTTVIGVGFGSVREDNLITMFGDERSIHAPLEDLAETLADELLDELTGPEELLV